jgi:hypothetical protein
MNRVPLLCDNESAIKIAYNSCEHSRTKHIDIQHHFLRDHAIKRDIVISYVRTNDQLADIFTKPLDEWRYCELSSELNIIDYQMWLRMLHIWFKLVITCWACFYVKILFMLKFMHVLWSYWFKATCMFWFSKLVHLWPIYVLLLAYMPNLSFIKFLESSKSVLPWFNQTCPPLAGHI